MYRHLTNTDHLVQEDLRLLITAIINKQKNSDNQRKITKNIIEINDVNYLELSYLE